MLHRSKQHVNEKKEKKANVDVIIQVNAILLCNILSKRECILVELQKRHKMTNSVLPQISIVVKPSVITKDMIS